MPNRLEIVLDSPILRFPNGDRHVGQRDDLNPWHVRHHDYPSEPAATRALCAARTQSGDVIPGIITTRIGSNQLSEVYQIIDGNCVKVRVIWDEASVVYLPPHFQPPATFMTSEEVIQSARKSLPLREQTSFWDQLRLARDRFLFKFL